jgi:hypothetical protein
MRDLVVAAVGDVGKLGGRVYVTGALGAGDIPAHPEWPFALVREAQSVPYAAVRRTGNSTRHDYLIYIYDERGSYVQIDEVLREVRDTLMSKEGTKAPSGVQCTGVEWFGTSGDLVNEELNSFTKFATVRVTANL